jgi:deoxyribose-phosphate aldolase
MSFAAVWQTLETQAAQYTLHDLIPMLDLTLLNKDATAQDIVKLAQTAKEHQVAAICIEPRCLSSLPQDLNIKRATVINFPSGDEGLESILTELSNIEAAFDELDYVFPYKAYLAGQEKQALQHCQAVFEACRQQGWCFKVILETGALPDTAMIYQLSRDVLGVGCDFLKTSTGKINVGARLDAAWAILSAIVDSKKDCGLKVSGGIRTLEQAQDYAKLAQSMLQKKLDAQCFRIGASQIPG